MKMENQGASMDGVRIMKEWKGFFSYRAIDRNCFDGKPSHQNPRIQGPQTRPQKRRWNPYLFPGRKHLLWDGLNMRITDFEDANQYVSPKYRKGSEIYDFKFGLRVVKVLFDQLMTYCQSNIYGLQITFGCPDDITIRFLLGNQY